VSSLKVFTIFATSSKFTTNINDTSSIGCKFVAGVIDTFGKFATSIVDTGGKFAACVVGTSGKFAAGVVDTNGAP
jgi:hypothetical protein